MPMGRLSHALARRAGCDDTNASFRAESQSFLHEVRNCSEWPDKLLQRLMSRRNGTIASARQLATSTLASIIARESGATQRRNPRDRV
jgi:hypothetical protein